MQEDAMSLELCAIIESGRISPDLPLAPITLGIDRLPGGTANGMQKIATKCYFYTITIITPFSNFIYS